MPVYTIHLVKYVHHGINLFLISDESVDLFELILQIKHINLIKIKCCKHIKFPEGHILRAQ